MRDNHDFCRMLLREARREAKEHDVAVPKRLTAISGLDSKQYFVEGTGIHGIYIKADCAYDAKAQFICTLIDAKGGNE